LMTFQLFLALKELMTCITLKLSDVVMQLINMTL
jgi:hypothetical protein